jgi:hypothetical protein
VGNFLYPWKALLLLEVFFLRGRPSASPQTNYVLVATTILANMTRLTISEDPGEEFAFRGHNMITDSEEDGIIFYNNVTKVHVLPECESFTIQVMTPDLALEMDFADTDSVREALELFETKKILEVNSEMPGFVRVIPSLEEKEEPKTYGEPFIKPKSNEGLLEQMPSRPDERLGENLPDTQKH